MAENVLSLIRDLTSSNSPLPSLTAGYTKPSTVFFSHIYKSFFRYSFTTAKIMYAILLLLSVLLVRVTHASWKEQLRGCFAVLVGMIGALLVPNVVAIIMTKMDKAMSWYTKPLAPVALYGPAGLLGLSHPIFITAYLY
jgi:FlaA1/EpsC-like NDP-sugar epimerase